MDGEFRIKVYIDDAQLSDVIDALNIGIFAYNYQIRKLFEYYTDDPDALAIADELTDLLASIDTEYPVRNEQYYDMVQRLSGIRTNK